MVISAEFTRDFGDKLLSTKPILYIAPEALIGTPTRKSNVDLLKTKFINLVIEEKENPKDDDICGLIFDLNSGSYDEKVENTAKRLLNKVPIFCFWRGMLNEINSSSQFAGSIGLFLTKRKYDI